MQERVGGHLDAQQLAAPLDPDARDRAHRGSRRAGEQRAEVVLADEAGGSRAHGLEVERLAEGDGRTARAEALRSRRLRTA